MKHVLAAASLALSLGATPFTAQAQQQAFTAGVVNLRAGPGSFYPIVNVIPGGLQVTVFGCLSDYSWCDVSTGPERGWIYAQYLNYPYQSGYAPLVTVGAVVGVAALAFILDDYWHDHYRHRSWYPERRRWERPGPPQRYALPPPPGYRARPHAGPPPSFGHPSRGEPRPHVDRRDDRPRGPAGEPPGQARRRDNGGPPGHRGRDDGPPGQRRRD